MSLADDRVSLPQRISPSVMRQLRRQRRSLRFNQNHDEHGKFTTGEGAAAAATARQVATMINSQAQIGDRSVTPAITALAAQTGGELKGLEFRMKTVDSLERKINDRTALGVSPADAGATVKDSLRYTIAYPTDGYTEGVARTSAALQAQGYTQLEMKNYWEPGDAYQGINSVWQPPTSGAPTFELQFHTPESYSTKQVETLADYHLQRDLSASPEERTGAYDRMVAASDRIPIPDDVMALGHSMGVLGALS